MGLFDSMFSPSNGILNFGYQPGDFYNPQDEAQAARDAAALRMRRGVKGREDPSVPFSMMQPGQEVYAPGGYLGGDMASLAGMMPQQSPQMQPAAPVPNLPQQAQTAQGPSGYLNDGPVSYPVFGQAEPQGDATLPPNARLTQGQAPQGMFAPPMTAMENAPSPLEKLIAAMNPAIGAQNTAQRNQLQMAKAIYGALQSRGMNPQQAFAVAQAAATDPKMAEVLLPQALGLKPPATIEGVIADSLYTGQQRGGARGQPSGDPYAELKKLKQAEAEGTNAGKTIGERQAAAQMDLPTAVAQAQEQIRLVGDLINHPGRKQIGWHDPLGSTPLIRGTRGYDADQLLEQIKGGSFLNAYNVLRGGGQITEVEGEKATKAQNRMSRATTKEEFDRAASDYIGIIKLGIDRANQQAGREAPFGFKGNSEWQTIKPNVRIRQISQ